MRMFLLGLFAGSLFGVFVMCMVQVGRVGGEEGERIAHGSNKSNFGKEECEKKTGTISNVPGTENEKRREYQ